MNPSIKFNLTSYKTDNFLWSKFVDNLGIIKAHEAIRQARDIQRMQGNSKTLPIILIETCGLALTSYDIINEHTGMNFHNNKVILILSKKQKLLQVLNDF